MLDIFALAGLESISDRLEERYGRAVAWWVTLTMCLTVIAALVALLYVVI